MQAPPPQLPPMISLVHEGAKHEESCVSSIFLVLGLHRRHPLLNKKVHVEENVMRMLCDNKFNEDKEFEMISLLNT